jgi:hypothetical protein
VKSSVAATAVVVTGALPFVTGRPASAATSLSTCTFAVASGNEAEVAMNAIIYLVGLIVVVMFILSFLGLR